jgi:glycosyltransferase involved in cell wall biosynthesis
MIERAQQRPRLTIAIPTVNRASLVKRALDSALAQTYRDIEIIVSNNGSTDDTRTVLSRYEGMPRVRILHRDKTIPAVVHGNFILEQVTTEFVLALSDDDWLEPTFAEKVIDLYNRHPELSFVWTGCFIHYADVVMPAAIGPEVESGNDFLAAFLVGSRNVCWCACVSRTADLKRIGPTPGDVICGDMFYWTKIAAWGPVGCVPEPVSHYVVFRDAGDNESGGTSVLTWAQDTARWVRDIVASYEKSDATYYSQEELRYYADRFLTRSVANQFVWQAIRGTDRRSLFRSVKAALPYLQSRDRSPWIRVIASLVAPKWLLRRRMLAEARRNARLGSRRAG